MSFRTAFGPPSGLEGCPIGCRHGPNRLKIEECPETHSTRMVGGMAEIERRISRLERAASASPMSRQRLGDPGMNLALHCTLLPCDVCQRWSVVSWESYSEDMGRAMAGGNPAAGRAVPVVIGSPGEYYSHLLLSAKALRTPRFSRIRGVDPAPTEDEESGEGGEVVMSIDSCLRKRHRPILPAAAGPSERRTRALLLQSERAEA